MRIDLTGKTAVVTGSTGGIGLATARALAAAGATVVINGRSAEKVARAVAEIEAEGGRARGVVADMGAAEGPGALAGDAAAADILVGNAAFIGMSPFAEAPDALWGQAWQTNVMANVALARAALPGMLARNWGRLVFVSSESARNLQPALIPYGATKLALHALSRGLAKTAAGSGVTANVVVPGPTLSDLLAPRVQAAAEQSGETVEAVAARFVAENRPSSILRRMASVEEVAAMIVYVCSPQASATTGAALRCDGGVIEDVN